MRCYEAGHFYFAPTTQWLVDFIARYLAILNSSINFFIYCLVGTQFRTTLFQMFGLKNKLDVPEINVETPSTGEGLFLKFRHDLNTEKSQETQSLLLKICPHKGRKKTLSKSSLSLHSTQSVSCISLTVQDSPTSDKDARSINLTFSTSVRANKEFDETSL